MLYHAYTLSKQFPPLVSGAGEIQDKGRRFTAFCLSEEFMGTRVYVNAMCYVNRLLKRARLRALKGDELLDEAAAAQDARELLVKLDKDTGHSPVVPVPRRGNAARELSRSRTGELYVRSCSRFAQTRPSSSSWRRGCETTEACLSAARRRPKHSACQARAAVGARAGWELDEQIALPGANRVIARLRDRRKAVLGDERQQLERGPCGALLVALPLADQPLADVQMRREHRLAGVLALAQRADLRALEGADRCEAQLVELAHGRLIDGVHLEQAFGGLVDRRHGGAAVAAGLPGHGLIYNTQGYDSR